MTSMSIFTSAQQQTANAQSPGYSVWPIIYSDVDCECALQCMRIPKLRLVQTNL